MLFFCIGSDDQQVSFEVRYLSVQHCFSVVYAKVFIHGSTSSLAYFTRLCFSFDGPF